jgi:FkbM family methyltransferase
MTFLRSVSKLVASRRAQAGVERLVAILQYLTGIGAGAGTFTTGEDSLFRHLQSSLHTPVCVFDVGANNGRFLSLALPALAGRAYSAHAFEPGAAAFKDLSAKYSGMPSVTLNHLALGSAPGQRTLYYDREGSNLASLTKRRLDHFGIAFAKSETVRIDTVDRYCNAHGISSIDLLKLDVEGHELEVLHGAVSMLDARSIRMISFEFGGCNIDTRTFFQDFYYFFARRGMRLARITPSGYWADIPSYKELYEQFRTTNYVAYLDASH